MYNESKCITLIKEGLRIKELVEKTGRTEGSLRYIARKNLLKIEKTIKEPAVNALTKQCKNCNLILSIENFYKQQQIAKDKTWHYFDSICIKCRLQYSKERTQNLKKQALDYKGWCCNTCGIIDKEFPQIYDFHHLDRTKKEFSISTSTKSFENTKKELDKCIVLCSNCHRREHAKDF